MPFGNINVDTVTTSTTGGILGAGNASIMKNRLINGAMQINQRVGTASQTITAGASTLAFNCDRWQVRAGGANATVQQVNTNNTYRMVFTGAASNTAVAASQSIEAINSVDLAGKSVTISVLAASSSLTSLTIELYYANTTNTFGTWGSPTVTSIGSTAVTISSTETLVSATFAVPSAAYTGLQVRLNGGALLASQTLSLGNAQLEVGSSATGFEYVNYQTSLANCQRYYYRTTAQTSGDRMGNGYIGSATSASVGFFYPVTMRTNPTALEQTGTATDYSVNWATSNTVCSAVPTFTTATTNFANVALTVASGLTTGQGCMARAATTSAYFGWSAEL